jgi:hypothetical protein
VLHPFSPPDLSRLLPRTSRLFHSIPFERETKKINCGTFPLQRTTLLLCSTVGIWSCLSKEQARVAEAGTTHTSVCDLSRRLRRTLTRRDFLESIRRRSLKSTRFETAVEQPCTSLDQANNSTCCRAGNPGRRLRSPRAATNEPVRRTKASARYLLQRL